MAIYLCYRVVSMYVYNYVIRYVTQFTCMVDKIYFMFMCLTMWQNLELFCCCFFSLITINPLITIFNILSPFCKLFQISSSFFFLVVFYFPTHPQHCPCIYLTVSSLLDFIVNKKSKIVNTIMDLYY